MRVSFHVCCSNAFQSMGTRQTTTNISIACSRRRWLLVHGLVGTNYRSNKELLAPMEIHPLAKFSRRLQDTIKVDTQFQFYLLPSFYLQHSRFFGISIQVLDKIGTENHTVCTVVFQIGVRRSSMNDLLVVKQNHDSIREVQSRRI